MAADRRPAGLWRGGRATLWAAVLLGWRIDRLSWRFCSAFSSLWSGSIELSVIEADRVLVYLGFFLAAFLIAQTDERRQRFAEGLAIAVTLVAAVGAGEPSPAPCARSRDSLGTGPRLATRSATGMPTAPFSGSRSGCCCGCSRHAALAALRWLSVAAIPAVLLALYFTYSRGGLLSLLVAVGCLIVLSRDRLWLLATLAIGAIGALPGGAGGAGSPQPRRQHRQPDLGRPGCDGAADPARRDRPGAAALRRACAGRARDGAADRARAGDLAQPGAAETEWRWRRRCSRSAPRSPSAAAPGTSSPAPTSSSPSNPEATLRPALRQPAAHEFWRVAVDAFGEEPVLGARRRDLPSSPGTSSLDHIPVHDAHSLYLQAFAELGVLGGLLVLALVGTLLWTGFPAWRAAPGPAARALRRPASRRCSPSRSAPPSTGSGRSPRWGRSSSSPRVSL